MQNLKVKTTKSPKQLIQELSKDRQKWTSDELFTFADAMISFLQKNKLKPEQLRHINQHIRGFLKDLLGIDAEGKYCIPLCELFVKHKFPIKLEAGTKNLLLEKWKLWVSTNDEDGRLTQIYTTFIHASAVEQSLERIQIFLDNHSYAKAKRIADQLLSDQIPSEVRIKFLELMDKTHTIEALELYITYHAIILKSSKAELFTQRVKEAVGRLLNGNLSTYRMEKLMEAASYYKIVNGDFWSFLLTKALKNEKTLQKAIDFFLNSVVPFHLMEDTLQQLYNCWKVMLLKMGASHDPNLKKLIANPQPILDLCDKEPFPDPLPLLESLKFEAFYCLKNELLTHEEYLYFYDFLSKHATSELDVWTYLNVYLLSSEIIFFKKACDKLMQVALILKQDKLEQLCFVLEKRFSDFPAEDIPSLLKKIVTSRCSDKALIEQFNIIAVFARSCPSTQDLLPSIVDQWVFQLLISDVESIIEMYEHTIVVLTDLILITNQLEFVDKVFGLMSNPFYLEKADENSLESFWGVLIRNYLYVVAERGNVAEILKGMDFFYAHFPKVYGKLENEKFCLYECVTTLNCLFRDNLLIYTHELERFVDFLAEGYPLWKFYSTNDESNEEKICYDVNFIKDYQMFPRAAGKIQSENLYVGFDQLPELEQSRLIRFDQWRRFSLGVGVLCESLLNSIPIGKEHEKFIVDFTCKAIERIMLGEGVIPVDARGVIQKNIIILLDSYLSRKGYLTAELFGLQLKNASRLYLCGSSCSFILSLSPAFIRYIFYLDKSVARGCSGAENKVDYELEFLELIQQIVASGNAYHLFRLCIVVEDLKLFVNTYSIGFRKKTTSSLKQAISKIPADFKDNDGFPLGKAFRQFKFNH